MYYGIMQILYVLHTSEWSKQSEPVIEVCLVQLSEQLSKMESLGIPADVPVFLCEALGIVEYSGGWSEAARPEALTYIYN